MLDTISPISPIAAILEINQDSNFVAKINESKYIESCLQTVKNYNYKSLCQCIIASSNPMYETLPNNEKKQYFKDNILKICTLIDENQDNYYLNYNFNTKVMKSKTIQYSLQISIDNKNLLSSLFYLNEFYKKHFVIIHDNKLYETSLKDYSKEYILFQNNKFSLNNKNIDNTEKDDIKNIPLENDIKKTNLIDIYNRFLEPIGKYKLDDIQKIATDLNISIKNNTKNKTKQDLYNEINIYHLNL